MKDMHRSRLGLVGLALAVGAVMAVPEPVVEPNFFMPNSSSPKGHGWGGKRRKLKKYMQDHQRPHRRRK